MYYAAKIYVEGHLYTTSNLNKHGPEYIGAIYGSGACNNGDFGRGD
jgi:hypothetical protein